MPPTPPQKMKTADDAGWEEEAAKHPRNPRFNSFVVKHRPFSFLRIAAITGNTFTELVRLKVFYFLLIFALLLIANSLFMARLSFQQEFQVLKDVSLGAMSIFTRSSRSWRRLGSSRAISKTAPFTPSWPSPFRATNTSSANSPAFCFLLALSILAMSALFFAVLFVSGTHPR